MIVLTIKTEYFNAIISGEKTIEYRRQSKTHETNFLKKKPKKLKLLCGRRMAECEIKKVELLPVPKELKHLEFLDTPLCFHIYLGKIKQLK